MGLQLDLHKSAGALRLSLEKAGIATPPTAEVCFDLDVSGSYERMHTSGVTNDLIARLIPWGMVFDPDKKLDVFTFSSGEDGVHYVGDINADNYRDYVRRHVVGRVPGWNGGTDYAPVLHRNLEHFGWIADSTPVEQPPRRRGFFSSLFGGGESEAPAAQATPAAPARKSLVLFNTDGANSDRRATAQLLQTMQDREYRMYVQFIAVKQRRDDDFGFIREMADRFSNCGLAVIGDIHEWVTRSDDQINEEFITDELLAWMKA